MCTVIVILIQMKGRRSHKGNNDRYDQKRTILVQHTFQVATCPEKCAGAILKEAILEAN